MKREEAVVLDSLPSTLPNLYLTASLEWLLDGEPVLFAELPKARCRMSSPRLFPYEHDG
ncbi:MAG: hypothetical protein QW057_06840 [Candidatus Bathyarchaeia archaeon]